MITDENEIKLEIPYDLLANFVTYLYTGSCQFINHDNVLNLYLLSDQYIVNLKQECEKYMASILTIDNIFNYYTLSNRTNASYLSNECIIWMNTHYREVINDCKFYDLDKKFIQKFLNHINK